MKIHKLVNAKGQFFKILETTPHSQVGVMTIPPGGDSGPGEIHPGDQMLYVIEGEAAIEVNRKTKKLSAGELAIISAGAEHHIYNKGRVPLFFLTLYAPPAY